VVHVIAPVDEDTVLAGVPMVFTGTAVDPPGRDLTSELVWTSSLDGVLGYGGTVTRALSAGTHRIRAAVTTPDGREGSGTMIVTAVPPSLEIAPDADTYVDESRPGAVLGGAPVLHVDSAPVRQSFLRFTVTGIGAACVERAVVRLTASRRRGAGSKAGGRLLLLDGGDWREDSTTYDQRPRADGRVLGTAGRVRRGKAVEFDVTSAVRVNDVYSFALVGTARNGAMYRSREAPHGGPRLVLTLRPPGCEAISPPQPGALSDIRSLVAASSDVGFEDFSYGPGVDQVLDTATASKPESKLWHHDGLWWATLYEPAAGAYRIHWLDAQAQAWVDSGVVIDERPQSRQDVLLDGGKLYVVSRFNGSPAQNRFSRYSYSLAGRTWAIDPGFPVDIPGGGTESMTIARDSRGTLWIAYTLNAQVFVSHTVGSDASWSTPFVVPVSEGTTVDADDIAGVEALHGAVGVFWSNQRTDKFYFAVHADGAPPADPGSWRLEVAAAGGLVADDHFNMKLASDGRLFVAVKTSKTGAGETLVGLLVRSAGGAWSPLYPVSTLDFSPTRPICLLDETRRRVAVFYSENHASIRFKESDLDSIAFPDGSGTPFIESASASDINNPTSTKQNLGPATGLAVLAASGQRTTYWHNALVSASTSTTTTTVTTTQPPTTTVTTTTATTSQPPTTRVTTTTATTSQPPTTTTSTPTTRPPTTSTTTTLPRVCITVLGVVICL
jgi:hypothetical protein